MEHKMHVPSAAELPTVGAAAEIEDFLVTFGGRWPPRPSFDWPTCLHGYHSLWEDSTTEIKDLNNPDKFREWMRQQLNEMVNLQEVLSELQPRLKLDDTVTLGLQACLQHVICFYRWGALPTNDEERARTKLDIPKQLWAPFTMISDLYGTTPSCTLFNLAHADTVDDEKNNTPVARKYWWNSDPKIRRSENNFFLAFTSVDNAFHPCLSTLRDYLVYTNEARLKPDLANKLLSKRVEELQKLREEFLVINKLFINYIQKKDAIDREIFPDYIQNMSAWGLDGKGGASGAEALTFALLDEFFNISGDSDAYVGAFAKRDNMTQRARQLLEKMANDNREDRFDSFIGLGDKENPLIQAKDQLLHSLYVWRLGHARASTQFMEKSKMTASKIVEGSLGEGETIAQRSLFMGTIRARETAQKIVNKTFKVPDLDAPAGY